jgi:hypothetical protein
MEAVFKGVGSFLNAFRTDAPAFYVLRLEIVFSQTPCKTIVNWMW